MTVLADGPDQIETADTDVFTDAVVTAPPAPSSGALSAGAAPKSLTSDALATAGLALFSLVVAAGFARVFAGWDFFDNLMVIVLVGHGLGLAARRFGLPSWATIPLMAFALFWTIGAIFYAATFSWGFPSGDTWTLFSAELELVREQFSVAVAPVLDEGGWPVLAAIGVAFAVCLSDAFAFGALARAEALVPGGVLFVFIAALGADRLRVELSVALVGAGVIATIILRAHHAPGGIRTAQNASQNAGQNAAGRLVWQALATATVVGLLAGYVGQRLPGAREEALFDTRGNGDADGAELSPLVDIRSRLTNQTTFELLVVTSNVESYWRATTLPDFDGSEWGPAGRAIGEPDSNPAESRPAESLVRQQIRIVGLAGTTVPAAPDPIEAGGQEAGQGDNSVGYDRGTSTLIADEEFSNGDYFVVVSAPPTFTPEALAAATSNDPGDDIYLDLPDDFPESVRQTALEVTAGSTNNYEAAIKLQNWFQSEFTYSLEVQQGHGNSAIEGFLRDRVGYCEQFAGTYAAMMRSLGIPARVAVGFSSGQAIGGGQFTVLGRNAHAWPEVWFDGLGWVLFEPTTGRGAPGAEVYTGLPAAQGDATEPAPEPDEAEAADQPVAPTTTTAVDAEGAGPLPGDRPLPPEGTAATAVEAESQRPLLALLVIGAAALAVVLPPLVRRIRRRSVGRSTDEQLAMLWGRALTSLRDVGVPFTAADTPREVAYRAASAFPVVSRPAKSLAEAVTAATYRPEGSSGFDVAGSYGSSTLRDGAHWTRQIERAANESMGTAARIRRYFVRWR